MQQRWIAVGCVAVVLQLGWTQSETEPTTPPSLDPVQITVPFVPDELVVGLAKSNLALPVQVMQMVGSIVAHDPAINSYVVRLAPGIKMQSAGEFLRVLPGVRYVEPNYLAFALTNPNDPLYSQQYGLTRIQANLAWGIWQPRRTVYIAILDTGIDSSHPDLTNKMRRRSGGAVYGYNTINNSTNAMDDHWHGTHCAGIAAAEINNGVGIAGVAAWNPNVANSRDFVQLMPVKVLDHLGYGSYSAISRGITWAADNGAHILSMSLGGSSDSQQLQDAVNYAWSRGCLLVAAAGNGGISAPFYPAFYTNCIAVAATDWSDTLASFSHFGSWVDIAAPGVDVLSTYPGNRYASASGTSMACPHVAGAAAMVWSHNPNLTNAQLRSLLETNVDPYQPYAGRTIAPNAGRLNVYRALGGRTSQPSLSSLSLNPSSVIGGNSSTGTVTLTGPAPAGGFLVNLSSFNTNVATVPSTVTVPAGATSANFTVSTRPVSSTTDVLITASAGGVAREATLTVRRRSRSSARLLSFTIQPTAVSAGQSATGIITLNSRTTEEIVVRVQSSNPRRTIVPETLVIPVGGDRAMFAIGTTPGTSTTVRITIYLDTINNDSGSAQLMIF